VKLDEDPKYRVGFFNKDAWKFKKEMLRWKASTKHPHLGIGSMTSPEKSMNVMTMKIISVFFLSRENAHKNTFGKKLFIFVNNLSFSECMDRS